MAVMYPASLPGMPPGMPPGMRPGMAVGADGFLPNVVLYRLADRIAPPGEPTTLPLLPARLARDIRSIRRFAERNHRNTTS